MARAGAGVDETNGDGVGVFLGVAGAGADSSIGASARWRQALILNTLKQTETPPLVNAKLICFRNE